MRPRNLVPSHTYPVHDQELPLFPACTGNIMRSFTNFVNISSAQYFNTDVHDSSNKAGYIQLAAGTSTPAILEGEVIWVALGGVNRINNGPTDANFLVQEGLPSGTNYSVQRATISTTQACTSTVYPTDDVR